MKLKILILLLLIQSVNAYTVQMGVLNLNGLSPIDNATVLFNNGTDDLGMVQTGVTGYLTFLINDSTTDLYYNVSKAGYYTYSSYTPITGDINLISVLTPISTDGIVRLYGKDITGQDRKIIVFYKENNRLHGVFGMNDTITLLVNREYIIKPQVTIIDSFSSINNIKNFGIMFAVLFGGLIVLIAIVSFAIGIALLIIRRIRGK